MFVDGKFQSFGDSGPMGYAGAMDFSPQFQNTLPNPPQVQVPDFNQYQDNGQSSQNFANMGKGAGDLFGMLNDMGAFGGESSAAGMDYGIGTPSAGMEGLGGMPGGGGATGAAAAGPGVTTGAGIMGPAAVLAPIGKATADATLGEENTDLSKPKNWLLSGLGGMGRDSIMDLGSGLPLGSMPFKVGKSTGNNPFGATNFFGGFGLFG